MKVSQEALDSVCGIKARLPESSHHDRLLCLNAVEKKRV
jgi:hypothetical protein